MPYCSSESKIQGFEEEMDIQLDSAEATEDEVLVELTLNRLCAGCGTEAASGSLEISIPFEHECAKADDDNEPEYEADGFDDPQTIDEYKNMKVGKHWRKVHLLGASVSGTVTCSLCQEEIPLDGEGTITVGEFEGGDQAH